METSDGRSRVLAAPKESVCANTNIDHLVVADRQPWAVKPDFEGMLKRRPVSRPWTQRSLFKQMLK
jgi:hypothetical protein